MKSIVITRMCITGCLILLCRISFGQMTIDTTHTPMALVNFMVGKESNLIIKSATYKGARQSIGLFSNPLKNIIPKGLILSTGNVYDAIGPHILVNKGTQTSPAGDTDLEKIAAGKTYDAAVLDICFTSLSDSISFNFFFASNEYPDFVDKGVNDVFAFFLCNQELKLKKNMAVIGPTEIPITINKINDHRNSGYFLNNLVWNDENIEKFKSDKDAGALSYIFNFNGMTTLLHAGSKVIPGKEYHLKIAIADVGDRIFDSAVFLEAGSFKSTGKIPANTSAISKETVLNNSEITAIINKDTVLSKTLNINFQFDSDKITDSSSFKILAQVKELLKLHKKITLKVCGHTDNHGDKDYNKKLSLARAKTVALYLTSHGIEQTRISYAGFGDTMPVATNETEEGRAKNRRVEFVFSKSR